MIYLSDNQLVKAIHDDVDLRNIWNGLPKETKQEVLRELDHDNWHLEQVIVDAAERIVARAN